MEVVEVVEVVQVMQVMAGDGRGNGGGPQMLQTPTISKLAGYPVVRL